MQLTKSDEGATAVVVALLMTALLGVGTIVIDVGSLYAERRQLQNGADAAALAMAPDCAKSACDATQAQTFANLNANDGAAGIRETCGTGAGLTPCAARSTAGWDCRALPTSGPIATARYVQVRTQTRTPGGSNLLPPTLARVLIPGYTGTNVRACARASWGAPASLTGLAMTISFCEWSLATADGTSFAAAPPYPPNPPTSVERVLKLHSTTASTACPAGGHAGSDAPGAFGWLDETGPCASTVGAGGTYKGDTGVGVSSDCKVQLNAVTTSPYPVVHVPVYQSVSGTGSNTMYTIKGFAAFVVTGYHLPGAKKNSWLYPSNPAKCSGSDKCIYGFFTQGLRPSGGTIGGPSMGSNVVQLSG